MATDVNPGLLDTPACESSEAIASELRDRWSGERPLGHFFRTDAQQYYYDSATNHIFRVEPAEAAFLSLLQASGPDTALDALLTSADGATATRVLLKVKELMDSDHVLALTRAPGFGLPPHYPDFTAAVETACGTMILDLTEACNLRCRYCVYGRRLSSYRQHGAAHMSWDVASRAIDYLERHSSARSVVTISFYGGEPLLNFDTLRRTVEYARRIMGGRQLDFAVTTNGTLMTAEAARFLKSHDFRVVFSMDGPRARHNKHRIDSAGRGTYDRARAGLELALLEYGLDVGRKKISLNTVYMPPFSRQALEELRRWKDEDPVLKDLKVHMAYPVAGSQPAEWGEDCEPGENESAYVWSEEDLRERWSKGEEASSIASGWILEQYEAIKSRPLYTKPPFAFHLNGCCLPGSGRVFVGVDGTLRVCEKIGREAPAIGSVYEGLDREAVKRVYVDEYERLSLPDCSGCWAIRMCAICYAAAIKDGRLDAATKADSCVRQRNVAAWALKAFCALQETPRGAAPQPAADAAGPA